MVVFGVLCDRLLLFVGEGGKGVPRRISISICFDLSERLSGGGGGGTEVDDHLFSVGWVVSCAHQGACIASAPSLHSVK